MCNKHDDDDDDGDESESNPKLLVKLESYNIRGDLSA